MARIGGDEFIALLVNTHCQYAEAVCKRVLYDFSKIAVNGSKITGVQASLGLVVAGNESAEEVIKRADSAMYEAKKQGKNRYFIEK